MRDLSGTVFRGEQNGRLREQRSANPYFFASHIDHARQYSGGEEPIACVLKGNRLLDLTSPDGRDADHRSICTLMEREYPEWVCRFSGQGRDFWSFLIGGDLYNYEGTGTGERWRKLFQLSLEELDFDIVKILDSTDGPGDHPSLVWVTQNARNVRSATDGEELAARVAQDPWEKVESWIKRRMPSLLTRVERLIDGENRYSVAHWHDLEPDDEHKILPRMIYARDPFATEIRPGDSVSLTRHSAETPYLRAVDFDDVLCDEDLGHLVYLPKAWRVRCNNAQEFLQCLSAESLRILGDGEKARIARYANEIERIQTHITENVFQPEACGYHHGPDHWQRVADHGAAVARAMGIDPLIPHLFGLIHDSHREDEGFDPLHGQRAAAFIKSNREQLFGFLEDAEVGDLAFACQHHSSGMTDGSAVVRACWDADRLDLWRVGIKPDPRYLCTPYAKRESTIRAAANYVGTVCSGLEEREHERE